MKRRVRFVENAWEESACDDNASLDDQEDALTKNDPEYPAVIMSTAGECSDDPWLGHLTMLTVMAWKSCWKMMGCLRNMG